MKLVNLTSDINTFKSIKFNDDFSVITGESQKKEDSRSHNLGKTTVVKIIEYVLFSDSGGFLKKIKEKFPDSAFSVKYKDKNDNEFEFSRDFHRRENGSIKEVQTSIEYEYFIRYQDEFDLENGFRKPSFRGGDLLWKPRLIGLLGFNENILSEKLTLNKEINDIENVIETIRKAEIKFESHRAEIDKLSQEKEIILKSIDSLKFIETDNADIEIIINELDKEISELKSKSYTYKKEIEKINSSLDNSLSYKIDVKDIKRVFSEVKLYFEKQLEKDFNDLELFYRNIYENRSVVLNKILEERKAVFSEIQNKLQQIDSQRSYRLKELSKDDSKKKYKELYDRLIVIEKRISFLERDLVKENIQELEKQLSKKQTESFISSAKLSNHIDNDREIFNKINSVYSLIMKDVMNIQAEIIIEKKSTGNVDLLLKSYRNNIETEELKGDTAKRISSAAIDIAIRSIQNEDCGFIIQDGVIDDVDSNTATQFVKVVKRLLKEYNFQYIMTSLKDRLPENIKKEDIILELNDYTEDGLLFGFRY
ncbi:MAG: hypothetical protein A2086_14735 [Spirochaetes bacterium GWD1_27_9]|nr:MAG: hypothetical protein A2Z98_10015 [Spirochaetes bacterium GWB1_27_13]OHD21093.1 MAG: hypothetical protein A2Y34_06275 [Spirochaetes bacterium GWC1_27_15]OHD34752.1 MAG: hypothetical protein A2086_14735 [Spirochaetes bacterium GWD1_27_9]